MGPTFAIGPSMIRYSTTTLYTCVVIAISTQPLAETDTNFPGNEKSRTHSLMQLRTPMILSGKACVVLVCHAI